MSKEKFYISSGTIARRLFMLKPENQEAFVLWESLVREYATVLDKKYKNDEDFNKEGFLVDCGYNVIQDREADLPEAIGRKQEWPGVRDLRNLIKKASH